MGQSTRRLLNSTVAMHTVMSCYKKAPELVTAIKGNAREHLDKERRLMNVWNMLSAKAATD